MQQNLVHWQSSTGQEQKNGAQSSMAYVKQEPVDQGNEQQYKSLLSSPRGLSSFSPSQAHGNAMTGTLKDDALEMQSARMGFSGITSTVPSNTASSSMTAQLDPNNSVILTGSFTLTWFCLILRFSNVWIELQDEINEISHHLQTLLNSEECIEDI